MPIHVRYALALAACLVGLLILPRARTQPAAPAPIHTGHYYLIHRDIAGTQPPQRVWDVQVAVSIPPRASDAPRPPAEVFTSLADPTLRQWVATLPAGSGFIYSGSLGIFNRDKPPAMPSAAFQAALDDFSRYCDSKHVTLLVLYIAG